MSLFFSGTQARSIYLCKISMTWRCQGSFLRIESWSTSRVRGLLQGTGNAYDQELSSVLLHLNPAKNLFSSFCRFCFRMQSCLAGCWLLACLAGWQNGEGISLLGTCIKSYEFHAACFGGRDNGRNCVQSVTKILSLPRNWVRLPLGKTKSFWGLPTYPTLAKM